MTQCAWVTEDPIYIEYHDNEWGKAVYNSQKLFEMLCLEGQQAGLSWITVLKKRQHYQHCFHQFSPEKIAQMTPQHIDVLMQDKGLIRNRLKLNAIVSNANAFLAMEQKGESFSQFIWQFVNNQPLINAPLSPEQIPVNTSVSDLMSRELKKRGFKFVGTTICYAFMQACGLVNDHLIGCPCHPQSI